MKKIINNKRYDTDTAKYCGCYENGYPGDFGHIKETLYQKKTGEFFLHGEGGASTKYAKAIGENHWTGGEKLIPLSFESAQSWAEEHLTPDEYETIFDIESDDDCMIRIGMQVSAEWWEKVKNAAKGAGKSATQFVIDSIRI